jgi:hypothetical protein
MEYMLNVLIRYVVIYSSLHGFTLESLFDERIAIAANARLSARTLIKVP